MRFYKIIFVLCVSFIFLYSSQVLADDSATIKKLNQVIEKLEKRIEVLEDKIEKSEKEEAVVTRKEARKVIKEELEGKVYQAPGLHEKEKAGFFGTAAVSYLKIGGIDDIDYVSKQHPDDSEGTKGDMESISFGWNPAYNVGVGYRFDGGSELVLSGWWLNIDESDRVTSNDDDLHAVLLHAETGDADDVDKAIAKMSVDMMRFGLDFTSPFYENDILRMSWSTGFRYMNIRQHLDVEYYDSGVLEAYLDAKIRNDLYGARLGVDSEFTPPLRFLNNTLSVSADLGVSLFANETKLDQKEGPLTVDAPIDIEDEQSNVVPAVDVSLGLVWRPYKPFSLSLKYEFMWLNDVFTLHQGLDDTSDGQSRQWEEDITLHGVTLEGTYTF